MAARCAVCGSYMTPFAVVDSGRWNDPVCRECDESGLADSLAEYKNHD